MEEEVLLTQPVFVSQFRCTGAACPDSCCNVVNVLPGSEDSETTQPAAEDLAMLNKRDDEWAQIKIDAQETCTFVAEASLCPIHKKPDPDALRQSGTIYPYVVNFSSATEEQHSVHLSCPEAVRLLLLNADAMKLVDTRVTRPQDSQQLVVNEEARLINLFCTYLLLIEEKQVETSLYAMLTFLLAVQKTIMAGSALQNLQQLTENYEALVKQMLAGETQRQLHAIKPNNQFQWELLSWMQNFIRLQNLPRGGVMKDNYLNPLNELMNLSGNYLNDTDRSSYIEHLRHAWSDKVRPWLAIHPHVLRNYLLYRCYHDIFPCHPKLSPLQVFYLLAVDVFFIKSVIAAKVVRTGSVDINDFINVIYGFHVVKHHSKEFEDMMIAKINVIKRNDDVSSLLLLL